VVSSRSGSNCLVISQTCPKKRNEENIPGWHVEKGSQTSLVLGKKTLEQTRYIPVCDLCLLGSSKQTENEESRRLKPTQSVKAHVHVKGAVTKNRLSFKTVQ
jgi:hypothetical protein